MYRVFVYRTLSIESLYNLHFALRSKSYFRWCSAHKFYCSRQTYSQLLSAHWGTLMRNLFLAVSFNGDCHEYFISLPNSFTSLQAVLGTKQDFISQYSLFKILRLKINSCERHSIVQRAKGWMIEIMSNCVSILIYILMFFSYEYSTTLDCFVFNFNQVLPSSNLIRKFLQQNNNFRIKFKLNIEEKKEMRECVYLAYI